MPTQEVSHWITLSLALIHKTDLTTTTVVFSNKATLDPGNSDNVGGGALPLIIGGISIGSSSDREMILGDSGSLKIDNSIGSFGVNRKFSDLLERYEIIDQAITLLYGTSEIGGLALETGSGYYIGKVLDWSHTIDQGQPTIDIRFDSKKIPKRVITKVINDIDFPDAPVKSLGNSLPIAIGEDVQVNPIIVDEDPQNPIFAYSTTLANEHVVGGIQTIYARDRDNVFQVVKSASNISTTVFENSSAVTTNTNFASGTIKELAYFLQHDTSTNNYIVTSVDIGFTGAASSTFNGQLVAKMYHGIDNDVNNGVGQLLATSIPIEVSTYDSSFDATTEFFIRFKFYTPVVMSGDRGFWLGVSHLPDGGSGVIRVTSVTSTGNKVYVNLGGGFTYNPGLTIPDTRCRFKFYGVKFTDSTSGYIDTQSGYGSAYATLDQTYSTPDLTTLNLIFEINGLLDDSSGTITGSASSQIATVHHAIELMSQNWNGSAWAANSDFDFDEYSDTFFSSNAIAGTTDGETTFEQWLRQVCRNTATRCVLLENGKVAPYSWGTTRTSLATFTQDNSKATRLEQLDSSYVVNRVTIARNRQLIYFDSAIAASQGIPSDYTRISKFNSETSTEYSDLIGNSEDVYGARELAEIYFNWIYSGDAATRIARYFLTNFNTPPRYVELEAPSDFANLEIMNVITIINPSLPNYYGGIPNAKLPHFEGEIAEDFNNGFNLCEAQSYRAQIEGKTLTFNEDSAPTLNLVCRILTNPNDPT